MHDDFDKLLEMLGYEQSPSFSPARGQDRYEENGRAKSGFFLTGSLNIGYQLMYRMTIWKLIAVGFQIKTGYCN